MEKLKIPRFPHICFTWANKHLCSLNPAADGFCGCILIPVHGQTVCEVPIRCVQVNGVHQDAFTTIR